MNTQRTLLLAVLLVAAIAIMFYRSNVLGEPASVPKLHFVVVTGGRGPYWQSIASGARAAARDLDVDLDVMMPEHDEDFESQAGILSDIDPKAVSGIALSPLDAKVQTRLINRLSEDTFVVTIDSDAPLSTRLSYVGASNFNAGQKCAQLTRDALPEGGKVAVLMANMTKDNLLDRKEGFENWLSEKPGGDSGAAVNIEVVGYYVDEGDDQRCVEQIRQLIEEHDDLACIVGMNARHGPILVSVLGKADKLGQIKLITFDAQEETLAGIEAGHIFGTIAQDPYQYGYEATRQLESFSRRPSQQLPPPGVLSTVNISTIVVRKDNVSEYRRRLKQRVEEASAAT
jgi:ribose transport system substrate-binding protein